MSGRTIPNVNIIHSESATHAGKTIHTVRVKQTLNRVRENRMPFGWSINPYRGCAHGCSFCYARAYQSYIGKDARDEFQRELMVKSNAVEALERQLAAAARRLRLAPEQTGAHIGLTAVGTATDPYQPIEAKLGLTRACLEVLAKYRVPTSITTRSPLILRDLDLLKAMNLVSVNISLSSMDASLTRKLEPESPLPAKRMEALEALRANGLPAGVFLAPVIPYVTDSERSLRAVYEEAVRRGAAFVSPSVLRLTPEVKPWFFMTLEREFPSLVGKFARLYRQTNADPAYLAMMEERFATLSREYGLPESHPERRRREREGRSANAGAGPEQLTFSF